MPVFIGQEPVEIRTPMGTVVVNPGDEAPESVDPDTLNSALWAATDDAKEA